MKPASYSGFELVLFHLPAKGLYLLSFLWCLAAGGDCGNKVIDDSSVGFAKQDGLDEMPH